MLWVLLHSVLSEHNWLWLRKQFRKKANQANEKQMNFCYAHAWTKSLRWSVKRIAVTANDLTKTNESTEPKWSREHFWLLTHRLALCSQWPRTIKKLMRFDAIYLIARPKWFQLWKFRIKSSCPQFGLQNVWTHRISPKYDGYWL